MEGVRPEAGEPESCLLEYFQARGDGGWEIQLPDLASKNIGDPVTFDFHTEQVKFFFAWNILKNDLLFI